jgi:catechol 2,3-dioxygenase-like lactoylglutathione lyase family enzyme
MQINGVAHIQVTAGNYEKALPFYKQLLPFLGLTPVMDGPNGYYCVGGRTGFLICPPAPEYHGERFVQRRVGLHHVCWRVRERADIDEAYAFLQSIGATIVHGPQEDRYAPGYYSVLFEDPDGVRLEINHVPGIGVFAVGNRLGGGAPQ